jgi:hypothetical protein
MSTSTSKSVTSQTLSQAAKSQTAANRYVFLRNSTNDRLVEEIIKKSV